METVVIAFCADKTMEAALHVAALSALKNLDPVRQVHIYVMVEDFDARDRMLLELTLNRSGRLFQLTFLKSNPEQFVGLPSLHGSWACYDRLQLPDMVAERRLVYVDVDTVITCDLAQLFDLEMGAAPLGVVNTGTMEWTLDKALRTSLGEMPTAPAFNSGLLLFNAELWREQKLLDECIAFGRKYADRIPVVDQTILNCLYAAKCLNVPPHYNSVVQVGTTIPPFGVLHYVGSPKPWDLGARWMLPYAQTWFDYARTTALPLHRRSPWLTPETWRRFPKILGGYRRTFRKRFGGKKRG